MADVTPDWEVERLRLERQRKQMELNLMDAEIRETELRNELAKTRGDIKALKDALKEQDARIAGVKPPARSTRKQEANGG